MSSSGEREAAKGPAAVIKACQGAESWTQLVHVSVPPLGEGFTEGGTQRSMDFGRVGYLFVRPLDVRKTLVQVEGASSGRS